MSYSNVFIKTQNFSYLIEDRLTVSMSVAGSFTGLSSHHLWFNSSDAYYHVSYVPESGVDAIVIAFPTDFNIDDYATWEHPASETSIQGGTLTATIDWITEDHAMAGFYGWAQEWDTEDEKALEAWFDYAPNDCSPYGSYDDYYGNGGNEGNGGNGGSGTPGFETLAFIAALGIALIISRKRNRISFTSSIINTTNAII